MEISPRPWMYGGAAVLVAVSGTLTRVILIRAVFMSVLDFLYIQAASEYGVRYQGRAHTRIVALENLVGLGTATAMAATGFRKGSRPPSLTANLLLLVLLSRCAFPYLGELA